MLLLLHIAAGFVALASGYLAALIKISGLAHRWHVIAGRLFFAAMVVIFCTAIPVSLATQNHFLLLIAIFSFYLALSGWSYARNRSGEPSLTDWGRAAGMVAVAIVMAGFGAFLLSRGNSNGITMLVFAGIGGGLGYRDLRIIRSGGVSGVERIGRHLTMMLAGTIATTTAFLVVNVDFEPAYIVWLAPTVLVTPIIFVMNSRIRRSA
ncbi:MAG: hypothetical protein RJQ10_17425 [Haliea sp.]|uniref:hypothetical protein n=1 Tax=Haliea sp. TaxID=1932666 RepID=UPI0032EE9986